MPLSISNSSELPPHIEPHRPVPELRIGLAAAVALVVFGSALAGWELYWRSWGAVPSYRNSDGLWAMQRSRIDAGEGKATVFIGSSRTLSNIQLDVWERLGGERPIQLALEGTSPAAPLESLADDPDFKGRLIVGVTPMLFFSGFEYRGEVFAYYPKETPSQRASQRLSMAMVEPLFAFYDPDFALFTILKRQQWAERPGVRVRRDVRKLFLTEADRNTRMWEKLERDPAYQKIATDIWSQNFAPPDPKMIAAAPAMRQKQIERAATAVAKLKARGVETIFVLHPAAGPFLEFERRANPREVSWDVLLARTGARGIHFEDHPELQGYRLPEWSHLATADAKRYTEALYAIIHRPADAAASVR